MSEDTAPLNEDAFHEIQLSGKQLVFLFMATTVVSVFIFLCGVLVGRGVRAERGAESSDATAAVTPSVAEAPAQAQTAPPTTDPPPAPESEDLSYHKRLQSDSTPREQLKPQMQQPQQPPPQPEPPAPRASASPEPAVPAVAAPPPKRDSWVVQLIVLKNRNEASSIVQRLRAKKYPAFVVEPSAGAVRAFKVQVGRYTDRAEAEQVARRLEKEEQFKPWILR